jgi:hypothetical protein
MAHGILPHDPRRGVQKIIPPKHVPPFIIFAWRRQAMTNPPPSEENGKIATININFS